MSGFPGDVLGENFACHGSEHEAVPRIACRMVEIFHVSFSDNRLGIGGHVVHSGPLPGYPDSSGSRQKSDKGFRHFFDELPGGFIFVVFRMTCRAHSAYYGTVRSLLYIVISRETHEHARADSRGNWFGDHDLMPLRPVGYFYSRHAGDELRIGTGTVDYDRSMNDSPVSFHTPYRAPVNKNSGAFGMSVARYTKPFCSFEVGESGEEGIGMTVSSVEKEPTASSAASPGQISLASRRVSAST